GEERQNETPNQAAGFLKRLNAGNCSLDNRLSLGRRQTGVHLNQSRNNLRKLLDCAERRTETAREYQRGDQGRPAILRSEQLSKAWPLKRSRKLLLLPNR